MVEDTILLDTLSGSDNNVVKATEALLTLGFTKKLNNAPSTPRITLSGEDELKKEEREKEEEARKLAALSRMKTLEEKNASKIFIFLLTPRITLNFD